MSPILLTILALATLGSAQYNYEANWDSLDARPLPSWYDEGKFGIFIHWGLFSVPSYGSEWFWYYWMSGEQNYVDFMEKNYRPGFTYPDFAPMFTAEFFDPDWWADLLQASGAQYMVLTSKHHEGFTMWQSNVSWNWNAVDLGPKRDLVGALANSVKNRTNLHFGLYHSLFEWFDPLYLNDEASGYETQDYVFRKTMPELYEIVNLYEPDIVWSDGDGGAPDTYWNSTTFLAWLYNESPVRDTVVVNDRWGDGDSCNHGGYYTCTDRYNPGVLQPHKWENCMTIDQSSWGYRREATLTDYLTIEDLISELASTVSCNGNLLMNIGPTHEGTIIPIFEERLRQMGAWLGVNGEGIYSTRPWTAQSDSVTDNIWYTAKNLTDGSLAVYAIVLFWPEDSVVTLGSPVAGDDTTITLLGYDQPLDYTVVSNGINVTFPSLTESELPCQWAWTLRLENLSS
jgi:alpha-L-fucosidase